MTKLIHQYTFENMCMNFHCGIDSLFCHILYICNHNLTVTFYNVANLYDLPWTHKHVTHSHLQYPSCHIIKLDDHSRELLELNWTHAPHSWGSLKHLCGATDQLKQIPVVPVFIMLQHMHSSWNFLIRVWFWRSERIIKLTQIGAGICTVPTAETVATGEVN